MTEKICGATVLDANDARVRIRTIGKQVGFLWNPMRLMMYAALLAGAAAYFALRHSDSLGLLVLEVAALAYIASIPAVLALQRKTIRRIVGATQYEADPAGLTIVEVDVTTRYTWDSFSRVRETPAYLILTHRQTVIPIPRRAFAAEDVERLRAFAQAQ